MSDFRRVTEGLSVSPQIGPQDVVQAAALGFVRIINNRPDGEASDQAPGSALQAAAKAAGLDYVHIPITGGPTPEQAAAQQTAVAEAGGPVLAFCRSGTRSITAWALGEAMQGRPRSELIGLAAGAGYDLSPVLR